MHDMILENYMMVLKKMNGKMATAPFLFHDPQPSTSEPSHDTAQKSSIDNVTNGARFCPGFNWGSGFAAAAALLLCQPNLGRV